jgi:lysozyme family protein
MSGQFEQCLAFTLKEEGGFVNNPADPGGATNFGVTLATYRHFESNPELSVDDIRAISSDTVTAIYSTLFWNAMRCDAYAAGVDLMVFDEGVNAGCARSIRMLQAALGFLLDEQDGFAGPVTLGAAAKADTASLITSLFNRQASYYQSLPTFTTFGHGWMNRVNARHAAAMSMIQTAMV